eukprot:TRINITY_DN7096_c0_g1_i1.p1 TRINITY_DN7096_c0_g1~~TRINITY_DN7096_c0_g1_i1.p1  ORF type:complete len:154 (-),score=32.50 TRINITY_DN7096_c0_g1_i1:169-630(-)
MLMLMLMLIEVSTHGICKLIDFGLSYVWGAAYKNDKVYQRIKPPEAAQNIYTKQSDVYQYGLLMIEILGGIKPGTEFHKEKEEYFMKWKQFENKSDNDVMLRLITLVESCLHSDPSDRMTFSEILYQLEKINSTIVEDQVDESPTPIRAEYVN